MADQAVIEALKKIGPGAFASTGDFEAFQAALAELEPQPEATPAPAPAPAEVPAPVVDGVEVVPAGQPSTEEGASNV